MNTRLGDILSEAQIVTDLQATNRWEAIDELIDHLVRIGSVKSQHRAAIAAAVKKRDLAMSTGIGLGVGIPHASTSLVREVVTAFGRAKRQINFEALDGQPVSFVMLILLPKGQLEKHRPAMIEFAKVLQKPDSCRALIQAPDAGAMVRIIKGLQSS